MFFKGAAALMAVIAISFGFGENWEDVFAMVLLPLTAMVSMLILGAGE